VTNIDETRLITRKGQVAIPGERCRAAGGTETRRRDASCDQGGSGWTPAHVGKHKRRERERSHLVDTCTMIVRDARRPECCSGKSETRLSHGRRV